MTWGMILNFAMLSWLPQLCQSHGHDHHDLTMIVNQVPDCLGEDHDGERVDRVLRWQQDDHRRPRHVEDVGLDCKSMHDDGDDHDDDDDHDDVIITMMVISMTITIIMILAARI